MKKFILKIFILVFLVALVAVPPALLIDPYNIFHRRNLRDNGVEPDKNFIKMSYILENPEKFDSFIFGSSRVGAIHAEKIADGKFYNMTYSVGTPAEHLANIRTFLQNGIVPKKIWIGVDSLSYTVNPASHIEEPLRSPYEFSKENPVKFYMKYFNPVVTFLSLFTTVKAKKTENFADIFYNYGWNFVYGKKTGFRMTASEPAVGNFDNFDRTLEDLRAIVRLCVRNDIALVVFTNPMCLVTYNESVKKYRYLEFLRELSNITPFYNFSGINDVTTNEQNYFDASHYNAETGDLIINCIENGAADEQLFAQGFGRYVNAENFGGLKDLLERQRQSLSRSQTSF